MTGEPGTTLAATIRKAATQENLLAGRVVYAILMRNTRDAGIFPRTQHIGVDMKPCGKAAWHIKDVTRPSGARTGLKRIQIAIVNQARYCVYTGTYIQSYAKKWLIAESGDYAGLTQQQVDKFLNRIKKYQGIRVLEER